MLDNIEQILSLAITAMTLLTTLGYFIARTFKNERALKYAQAIEDIKIHVKEYMSIAENLSGMNGQEKKSWVIQKTQSYLLQKDINVSDDLIEVLLEEMILFSKQINSK